MIVKFLASKNSKGSNATKYLLDKDNREENGTAKILIGDRDLTDSIINNIKFSQKATLGVLSFQEKFISTRKKKELMLSFEQLIFGDMPPENYNILWVEHSDKDRVELNFVIPKIELSTKKSFNPFWDRMDRNRIDTWKRIQNLKYDFHDPDALKNKQDFSVTINKKQNELTEDLNTIIFDSIGNGLLKSRDDIIDYIKKNDIEIMTKKDGSYHDSYLSIKFKNSKKAVRLKGAIYGKQFTDIGKIEKIYSETKQRIREQEAENREAKIKSLETKLAKYQTHKNREINNLYKYSFSDNFSNHNAVSRSREQSIQELLDTAKLDQREREEARIRDTNERTENKQILGRFGNAREQISREDTREDTREREPTEKNNKIREEARRERAINELKLRKYNDDIRKVHAEHKDNIGRLRSNHYETRERNQRARRSARERNSQYYQQFQSKSTELGSRISELERRIREFNKLKKTNVKTSVRTRKKGFPSR